MGVGIAGVRTVPLCVCLIIRVGLRGWGCCWCFIVLLYLLGGRNRYRECCVCWLGVLFLLCIVGVNKGSL